MPIKKIFLRKEAFKELFNLGSALILLVSELNVHYTDKIFNHSLVLQCLEILNKPLKYIHLLGFSEVDFAERIHIEYKKLIKFYNMFNEHSDMKSRLIFFAYKNLSFCKEIYNKLNLIEDVEIQDKVREDVKEFYEESLKTLGHGNIVLEENDLNSIEIAVLEVILASPIPQLED